MVRKILVGVAALVVVSTVVIISRPPTFHVERSVSIAAPPQVAFAQVNDFHAWGAWSPWEKIDPEMKKTFGGPATGVGSVYGWTGNDKVGEGKMTIEKSDAPSVVGIKLEFVKPFAATNRSTFTFTPVAEGTKLTWAMDGENNFMGKVFSMFMDMDKMVGGDFERGLASLKAIAESVPLPSPQGANAGP